jgi:hypothetical protein
VFKISPRDFWGMTPVEFWWCYPQQAETPSGGMSKEWLEWAMRKYPDRKGPTDG